MARPTAASKPKPILQVQDLQVFYGESHALQGVSLTLERGVLSVVGRNGMGKTTLCNAIVGLVPARAGSIRLDGRELIGLEPHVIARMGVGFVPQGRRLWPSLSVDETLRLASRGGAGSVERVYSIFPRLAERRDNGGGQLSGGEQQMLAIGRALLGEPKLLVMDEPTEGLAPLIVGQVRDLLIRLAHEEDLSVLVVEQNIGVATSVSDHVAVMVNGRVNRIMDATALAADRDLQQRLLGVGRHGHGETDAEPPAAPPPAALIEAPQVFRIARGGAVEDGVAPAYRAEHLPNRWGLSTPAAADSPANGGAPVNAAEAHRPLLPLPFAERFGRIALVVGTFDTKGEELRFIRDRLRAYGVPVRTVDLSTSGKPSRCDVTPLQVAAMHPGGSLAVFSDDRGAAVTAMAEAFARWIERERGIGGIISAGGSGGTTLASAGMRRLPLGMPKIMVSTVASGQVAQYVGVSDIMMLYSVADVQGVNAITEQVLGNAAHALAGMIAASPTPEQREARRRVAKPAIGLTMFGVTTPAVQGITHRLEADFDCLVFHATGTGGRSMESLADSGLLAGFLDITTTEVADMLVGGVFPCDADRFGAAIRTGLPWVGSVGALDMVNFGPRETVPERFRGRRFVVHNPSVTLMRTTPSENAEIGEWIGRRLNLMEGPVRLLLPEGGVSALDAQGKPFHDPEADAALFQALERTVLVTARRRVERIRGNINDDAFIMAATAAFLSVAPRRERRA